MSERDKPMDDETLQYPAKIASRIGLGVNEVNAMKRRGCPFYGRKTSVKWVRAWLARQAGAEYAAGLSAVPEPHGHHQATGGNKPSESHATND